MGNIIPYAAYDTDLSKTPEPKKKKGIYFLTIPSIPHPNDQLPNQTTIGETPDAVDLRSQIEPPYTSKNPNWQIHPINVEMVSRQLECVAHSCDHWKGRVSRLFWPNVSHQSLTSIRDIYDAVRTHGMIPESMEHKMETSAIRVAARPFRLLNVKLLPRKVHLWESFLSQSCPIVISLALYQDPNQMPPIYEFPEQSQTITMVLPALVVGYDSKRDIFIVQGPFTRDWGEDGYIALPYEYIESTSVVLEMWVAKFSKHIQASTELDFDTISLDVSKMDH